MGTMTDFWAREWLLEDIALRHAINDLDTAIQIGQQAGLLTSDVGAEWRAARAVGFAGLFDRLYRLPRGGRGTPHRV